MGGGGGSVLLHYVKSFMFFCVIIFTLFYDGKQKPDKVSQALRHGEILN